MILNKVIKTFIINFAYIYIYLEISYILSGVVLIGSFPYFQKLEMIL